MPTTRPRHLLTETDEVAAAIDAAAAMYPGQTRADVLRHLVELGAETVAQMQDHRRHLVRDRAGRHPGVYPAGYLEQLRSEWPE
ncbi:MAG: hypothetical protein Q7V88_10370 [Actinomycetota bacterium]|nr:hypothetical protein [Actinomycetota bacterium]